MRIRTSLHLPTRFVLLGLLAAQALVACGGGAGSGGANERAALPVPPMAPVPANAWEGRYVGSVTIGGVKYNGDALLTDDGLIRLYIGGPDGNSGLLPEPSIPPAETSMQFYGSLQGSGDQASGQGNIFGQQCASPDSNPFCDAAGFANISIAVESGNIQGQIVVTNDGNNIWTLLLNPFSNYYLDLPASRQSLEGQYHEELAEFALDGDTIVSINAQGVLSFQSPHSGCTGIGRVEPHLNGAFDVYDASLSITGCTGSYVYLNSTFVGLATTSPSSQWNYDSLLLIWLTQQNPDVLDGPSPPALTMLGSPLNQ